MVINISPELAVALADQAQHRGVTLEQLVLQALRDRFLPTLPSIEPRDDWERRLFGAAVDCGVSIPDSALTSDGLYE